MDRRKFLLASAKTLVALSPTALAVSAKDPEQSASMDHSLEPASTPHQPATTEKSAGTGLSAGHITLFLCGDVMIGRGIDQILPYPNDPHIHEPYMRSALGYVKLAEEASGPIPRSVDYDYIWGDALDQFRRFAPDVRIINLETAVTRSDTWLQKGINYRMHPENIPCLNAGGIDCCVLANNHVLDWGHAGLQETLATLRHAGLHYAGAGPDLNAAQAPAVLEREGRGRVLVFAFGSESSGIPGDWSATKERAGVNLLRDLSDHTLAQIAAQVHAVKRPGDTVVASIHWGSNWGYAIPTSHIRFAHGLIDEAAVDVVHGHSSHHVKGIEVYKERPIIYGCGDFLNDYEGIGGYEQFRGDLSLMYFPTLDAATGRLAHFQMSPMQTKRFRLNRAAAEAAHWLQEVLMREGRRFGTRTELNDDLIFSLLWE